MKKPASDIVQFCNASLPQTDGSRYTPINYCEEETISLLQLCLCIVMLYAGKAFFCLKIKLTQTENVKCIVFKAAQRQAAYF